MTHLLFFPPYLKPLIDQATAKPGQVTEAVLYHDTGCPRLRDGLCTCQPVVELLNRRDRRAARKERR